MKLAFSVAMTQVTIRAVHVQRQFAQVTLSVAIQHGILSVLLQPLLSQHALIAFAVVTTMTLTVTPTVMVTAMISTQPSIQMLSTFVEMA
jgi:hypothetical protein